MGVERREEQPKRKENRGEIDEVVEVRKAEERREERRRGKERRLSRDGMKERIE